MPYNVRKRDDEWCVYNSETGDLKGCSDSEVDAKAHMRALYAAEDGGKSKEMIAALVEKSFAEATIDTEIDKAVSRREDVSPAERKRAQEEYGDVTYADPANKKYPIDTEAHILSLIHISEPTRPY